MPCVLAFRFCFAAFLSFSLLLLCALLSAPSVSCQLLAQPVSVQFLPGGVEDPLHFHSNCSCFDRHSAHILMVVDVLDISYYYQVLIAGAQRAAQDMGSELYIVPSTAFSASQMANSVQASLSTPLFAYWQGAPDVIISALPGSTALDEPLSTLLNVYQQHHIPFASIHSANINLTQALGDYDSGFLFHIGADNYLLGQNAANEIINRTRKAGGNLAQSALCLTDLLTNEASIDRCNGFSAVLATLGISTQIFEVNTITQSPTPVQNLLIQRQQVGAAIPILAIDGECTGVLISSLTEYDLLSNATRQGITSNQLVAVAAVDIPPTTAQALLKGTVLVAFDQQPFWAGYMSVAIASLYIRTSTYPSNRFYSTGPLMVDANTPQLLAHANAEFKGFPECSATVVTYCFNRTAAFFESSHQLVISDSFGANVRSGLYQGTFDMRVRDNDLMQPVKINSNNVAQMQSLSINVAGGNLSLTGIIAVPRDPVNSLQYFRQLISMNVPVVTINNAYGSGLPSNAQWGGPYQPIAHVGTDDFAFARAIGNHFIALQSCKQVTILDPDGSYASDDVYQGIQQTIQAAGIACQILPAPEINPTQAAQLIQSYYQNGTNCFLTGSRDILVGIMANLNLLGKPGIYVGTQDYTPYIIKKLAQGLIAFAAVQNEYYQGYLPMVLQTVMAITGGAVRGNRPLKTLYTYESTYDYVSDYTFPYIESGPQFITGNTRNIQRIAACGAAVTGTFANTVVLPGILPITQFPFAQIAYPVCLDPPSTVSLAVILPASLPQMQLYAQCQAAAAAQAAIGGAATSTCSNPFNSTTTPVFNVSYATESDTMSLIGSVYTAASGSASGFVLAALDFGNQLLSASTVNSWSGQSATGKLTVYSQVVSATSSVGNALASVSQLGTTAASLSSVSVANFSDYSVVSAPGSTVNLRFYVALPDGRVIYSNVVTLSFQACSPGYFVQNNLCAACPSGYTSYVVGAQVCVVVQQSVPVAASAAVRTVGGLLLCGLVSVTVVLLLKMKSRVVLSYSPLFCIISLSGLVLAVVSAILMVDTGATPALCTASTWLFNVGFTVAFSAVWAKTFRLWRIFGNPLLQMLSITNTQLMLVIAAFTVVDVAVLAAWTATSPYSVSPADDKYLTCVSDNSDIFNGVLIAIKSLWILSGAVLIREIRRLAIPSKYNESEAMALAIYNVAIIGAATVGIWFGLRGSIGESGISILLAIATFLAVSAFAGFLFFPMVKQLYTDKKLHGVRRSDRTNISRSDKQPHSSNRDAREGSTASGRHTSGASLPSMASYGEVDDTNDPIHALLALSEEFERVMREIQAKPAVHSIEKAILDTYPKLKANRKKALDGYLGYKQDLFQIAKLNAELFFVRRAGRVKDADLIPQGARTDERKQSHFEKQNTRRTSESIAPDSNSMPGSPTPMPTSMHTQTHSNTMTPATNRQAQQHKLIAAAVFNADGRSSISAMLPPALPSLHAAPILLSPTEQKESALPPAHATTQLAATPASPSNNVTVIYSSKALNQV